MTITEELLELANKKARELQRVKYGEEYGINSTQVTAALLAVGEMLDQIERAVTDTVKKL